jgi:ABC-type glycerol-3-phosphate transport system substrate-binding protein
MKRFILAAALAVAACGGGKSVKASGDETPDWVAQGTGEVNAEAGKKVQGVGSAGGADAKARRLQADAAAKTQLDSVVTSLSQAFAKMSDSKKPDDVAGLAKAAAAQSQQIKDHWVGADGTELSLDVVDLAAFKTALGSVDGDDKLKKEMAANADKAFDQVAKK